MAEQYDNQPGRMLFTDFDVSDKGRPVSVLADDEPDGNAAAQPLQSIEQLAASIELNFEDDEDGPASAPPARNAAAADDDGADDVDGAAAAPAPAGAAIPGDDQELSLDQAEDLLAEVGLAPLPPIAGPTWEEFANAFRAAPETPEADEAPAAARDGADAAGWPPPDEDARSATAPTDAYDPIADGDEDVDILSFLSDPAEAAAAAPRDRRTRVAPPPAQPYGGIERVEDWFSPPENQYEPPPTTRDWFEPPEAGDADNIADLFDTVILAGGHDTRILEQDTRILDPDRRIGGMSGTATGDTDYDIFSGLDVDATWSDRVRNQRPRPRAPEAGETQTLDLFSDMDLESVWKSRRGRRVASDSARRFAEDADADADARSAGGDHPASKTTVLGKSALDASDTILLDSRQFFPPKPPPRDASGDAPRSPRRDAPRDAGPAAPAPRPARGGAEKADDGVDVLTQLDDLDASAYFPGAPEEDGTDHSSPTGDFPAVPPARDYLDVMDELDDGTVRDVQAPTVDSSDIQDVAALRGGPEPEPERPAVTDGFDAFADDRERGGAAVADPEEEAEADASPASGANRAPAAAAAFGPGAAAAADDYGADYDLDAEEEDLLLSPSGRRAFTADDAANAVDFEGDGVNAGVRPPVVGDGDIDTSRKGPSPGTEEMRAVAGEGEADVAVNPLDVFANMDDMDFSDDVDDDMRAMMEAEEEGAVADVDGAAAATDVPAGDEEAAPPAGMPGKIRFYAVRAVRRAVPMSLLERVDRMVAWKENWWFYCDLLAAIIASASLAVIISYYVWFSA